MTEQTDFIISCLRTSYQIEAAAISLLPLGADVNASIYKVRGREQKSYFVKLKRAHFKDVSFGILELLQMAGIEEIILPIKTVAGKQAYQAQDFTVAVYPYIAGQDGFSRSLTDEQWIVLGRALRQVHEINVPASLRARLRRENFSPKFREAVTSLYDHKSMSIKDEVASDLWKFLKKNRSIIQQLVERSLELSQKVSAQSFNLVLCHSDIHAGNVLLDKKGALYIVDWDDPILAPKERDLMFIGAGIGNVWNKPYQEKLFYQGYGHVAVDFTLMAYYRYERIVEDIADFAQELLLKPTEGKDRIAMYKQFMGIFSPNGMLDIAAATDKHLA